MWGLPSGLAVKNLNCIAECAGDTGSVPGSGTSPGGGNGNLLQYYCLEYSIDSRAWWATVHRVAKSQTQQSDWTHNIPQHMYAFNSKLSIHLCDSERSRNHQNRDSWNCKSCEANFFYVLDLTNFFSKKSNFINFIKGKKAAGWRGNSTESSSCLWELDDVIHNHLQDWLGTGCRLILSSIPT